LGFGAAGAGPGVRAKRGVSSYPSLIGLGIAQGARVPADSAQQREIDSTKKGPAVQHRDIFVDRVTGTVPIINGSVTTAPGSSIPISVTAGLDATPISSGDRDRDSSLESPDYFETKSFRTWTFASAKIVPSGTNACAMDEMLSIHGVTQPEHLR
jgi:polyisoprenoid-binding protein YceI